MTASLSIYNLTHRIEAERVTLENLAVDAAARIGHVGLRHAIAAMRIGSDPITAVRDVLWGNPALGLAGLETLIARALVTSHLLGLKRTALTARQHFGRDVMSLSRAGDKMDEWYKRLTGAALIAETEVVSLFQRAKIAANRIVRKITAPLFSRVAGVATIRPQTPPPALPPTERRAGTFGELPDPEPLGLPKYAPMRSIVEELGRQFAKAGFVPGAEHGIAAELGAGMVRSYESGRARGWRMTPIKERLWGLHYAAVLDLKTTMLCLGLDGTVLPADDPLWKTYTPPNHYGCRSCVLEVWESSALKEPPAFIRNHVKFGPDFFIG